MRNVLAHVSHSQKEALAADLKSIFAQPNRNLASSALQPWSRNTVVELDGPS